MTLEKLETIRQLRAEGVNNDAIAAQFRLFMAHKLDCIRWLDAQIK